MRAIVPSNILTASSCMYASVIPTEPYLRAALVLAEPHNAAVSVAVTSRTPVREIDWIAESRKFTGEPNGSRSIH